MLLLDTNVVIGIMTRRVPRFVAKVEDEVAYGTELALPVIVVAELVYGAKKSQYPERNLARLGDFSAIISRVVSFDRDDAAEAGDIRAALELRGTPIGANDLLIAAQARRRQAVLVTNNRREFDRVPGLMVTDWGLS